MIRKLHHTLRFKTGDMTFDRNMKEFGGHVLKLPQLESVWLYWGSYMENHNVTE